MNLFNNLNKIVQKTQQITMPIFKRRMKSNELIKEKDLQKEIARRKKYNTRSKDNKQYIYKKDSIREIFKKRNRTVGDSFRFESSKKKRKKDGDDSNFINNRNKNLDKYYIKFDGRFKDYLSDVEKITGVDISYKQRKLLQEDIESHRYTKQTSEQNKIARQEFSKMRADLIEEWQHETGNKWGTYKDDLYSKNGKIIRCKGQRFDAHHLNELSYGGRPVWYNLHPARFPDQHQQSIHRKGGLCNKIFI
jgi:hypothetical protein